MRKIKFRGWAEGRMFYPNMIGSYYTLDGIVYTLFGDGDEHPPTVKELMQFTGLQDKNGVDIYEGDIVSLWYAPRATARGKIEFENGGFYFKTTEAKPNIFLAYDCVYEHGNSFTVIGNIHQSPGLLTNG